MKRNNSDLNNSKIEKDKEQNSKSLQNSTILNQSINSIEKEKIKKFAYLNQKVQIPTIYYDRVEYIKELCNNEELGFIIAYAPSFKTSTSKKIGKYFKTKLKNIIEIANGVIFYFFKTFNVDKNIFDNKTYQIRKNSSKIFSEREINLRNKSPDEILQSGEFISADEACTLYREICGWAGVKIDIVSGLFKKIGYKLGDSLIKHKWCIINCGIEKSYFIDPLLIIGETNDQGEYIKEFNPFYFLTPPLFFLENHLPDEEKYQLLPRTIKVKEFSKIIQPLTETFYNSIFKYKIYLENYKTPVIECKDSEIVIKFIVNNLDLDVVCTINGKKLSPENTKITDSDLRSNYIVTIIFPSNGEYILTILGKPITSHDDRIPIFSYKINVVIKNIITHEKVKKKVSPKKIVIPNFRASSPQFQFKKTSKGDKKLSKCASDFGERIKRKCYDNSNAHLYEPKSKILKIGQETKFKIRIKNAKCVAVLDGKKWNYLKKRDEENFEGIVPINCENVVLIAMRNNNVFTEIFEFLAIRR